MVVWSSLKFTGGSLGLPVHPSKQRGIHSEYAYWKCGSVIAGLVTYAGVEPETTPWSLPAQDSQCIPRICKVNECACGEIGGS